LLAAVFEAMVPWIWAVVPGAWFGAVPSAIDGLLLAGLELINLNTLLLLTGAEKRAQFLAIYSAILSTAAMVGPLLGGALSDRFGLPPVFALAGALSLAGCALYYAFVPEPPEVAVCRIGESP
jgi:MFS family permease